MIVIDWANANSGFLLVVLTAVYVFATVAILIVMAKANHLSATNIQQTADMERSRLRPYVSMRLKIVKSGSSNDSQSLPYGYLLLRNSGITQAYNISIDIEPQIYSEPIVGGKKTKKPPYFIENEVFNLAPGEEISDDLGFLPSIYDHFPNPRFRGSIYYRDASHAEYRDEFVIDFASMKTAIPYIERERA